MKVQIADKNNGVLFDLDTGYQDAIVNDMIEVITLTDDTVQIRLKDVDAKTAIEFNPPLNGENNGK